MKCLAGMLACTQKEVLYHKTPNYPMKLIATTFYGGHYHEPIKRIRSIHNFSNAISQVG